MDLTFYLFSFILYLKINSSHRPTFPGSFPPSIIGADVFNFRVRDGIGWVHVAMGTKRKNKLVVQSVSF
jgi:hypothetical protein